MSNYFSENLKYLREQRNIEQKELAEALGYKSASAVSEWEKGIRIPNFGVISNLASLLGITVEELMERDLSKTIRRKTLGKTKAVPLLGTIAAGTPILAEQNIEEYFNIDSKIKADFCLRIHGDSMINVNIMDKDIVFIRQQEDLESGEIGAILVDNTATLKRFYKTDGQVILQAENPEYRPIILSSGDVRIMGKMVASLRQYK